MSKLPECPMCHEDYTYEDQSMLVCPMCAHEWTLQEQNELLNAKVVKDSNGIALNDGDSITIIKDLKVKGSSTSIKMGTKVKKIRLVESSDGHNIDCRIDGFGAMKLKSEFVKKL